MHDHTAALTGRFASRQHSSLARPVSDAAVFDVPMTDQVRVRHLGARVGRTAPDGESSRDDQSPGPRARLSARRL